MSSATTSSADSFLKDAAQGGAAEVEMGKVAVANAQNPEVKKFGQMMVDDHTKAGNELKELAGKKNIAVPADIGSHKSMLDKLKGLKGADFDKEYVSEMVSDHETDVAEFEKQAANATDPDVKAFAAKTLPTLKKHLDAIKAIQAKMK
jgi:putative membrane protein